MQTKRPLPAMLVAAVISLALGYVVLEAVNAGIAFVWESVPENWDSTPAWYVIGVLLIAAVLVYVVRKFVGDTGHSPLGGIKVSPLSPKEYLGAILAILASLWGGIVLGPEVALVATGSVIGGLSAKLFKVTDLQDVKKVVGLGALGGILALFVGPILSGNMQLGSTPTAIEVDQLGWAILVAIIATIAVTVARLIAALLARATGGGPHLSILVGAALVIAATALIMQAWTGEGVIYVTTSGEELITELPTLTSASTVAAIILLKTIAYAVSLGYWRRSIREPKIKYIEKEVEVIVEKIVNRDIEVEKIVYKDGRKPFSFGNPLSSLLHEHEPKIELKTQLGRELTKLINENK